MNFDIILSFNIYIKININLISIKNKNQLILNHPILKLNIIASVFSNT